jgi:hypothetical protein
LTGWTGWAGEHPINRDVQDNQDDYTLKSLWILKTPQGGFKAFRFYPVHPVHPVNSGLVAAFLGIILSILIIPVNFGPEISCPVSWKTPSSGS